MTAPRYDSVAQALPPELPPITRSEATRAYRALVKHFGVDEAMSGVSQVQSILAKAKQLGLHVGLD